MQISNPLKRSLMFIWAIFLVAGIIYIVSAWPTEQRNTISLQSNLRPQRENELRLQSHLKSLREKIPSNHFSIVVEKPFVVIGDLPEKSLKQLTSQTIRWAVRRLKRMYFPRDPEKILDIWVFNGKASYEKHCWEIFAERPDTPFGYSSPKHNALIMNIKTGSGTLVHELVHPFMAVNFPQCPAWFNEGLASLYEQCKGEGDQITGLTNWRLPGLQAAIKHKHLPSFKKLTSTTNFEFYQQDPGTNYAQSRYLCYYLQEHNLLVQYYHAFLKNHPQDPTGYHTLREILGGIDMQVFQKKWQDYILTLKQ